MFKFDIQSVFQNLFYLMESENMTEFNSFYKKGSEMTANKLIKAKIINTEFQLINLKKYTTVLQNRSFPPNIIKSHSPSKKRSIEHLFLSQSQSPQSLPQPPPKKPKIDFSLIQSNRFTSKSPPKQLIIPIIKPNAKNTNHHPTIIPTMVSQLTNLPFTQPNPPFLPSNTSPPTNTPLTHSDLANFANQINQKNLMK